MLINSLYTLSFLLTSNIDPRIWPEIEQCLHLSEQTKIGDWYLYHNYIEIRVDGCEFPPYKFLEFIPMTIFSLGYIRQMIKMDEVHFVAGKRKSQFKIKIEVAISYAILG